MDIEEQGSKNKYNHNYLNTEKEKSQWKITNGTE